MELARVLIDTLHIPFIEEKVWLSVGDGGFDIHIKEGACFPHGSSSVLVQPVDEVHES